MKQAIWIFTLFISSLLKAAPYPATSTSILTDPEKGYSFLSFGFKISTAQTSWKPQYEESTGIFPEIRFEPKAAINTKATMALRMDELSDNTNLTTYARKWMREYPQYGLEVLGTKSLKLGGGNSLIIDLFQKTKGKQLRQVVFQKNKKLVILTCQDQQTQFNNTLNSCNQIIRSFEWIIE